MSIFKIMSKVRIEAMCWGAGTALGELPPYFMARAARLSGYDPDDETETDLKELEELERKLKNKEQMTLMEKLKVSIEMVVERVGFLGILACASVSCVLDVFFVFFCSELIYETLNMFLKLF